MAVAISSVRVIHVTILMIVWSSWNAEASSEQCVQSGPCSCSRGDGTVLDMTPLHESSPTKFFESKQTFRKVNVTFEISVYQFHPCVDATFTPVDTSAENCKTASLCRRIIQLAPTGTVNTTYAFNDSGYNLIGIASSAKFQYNSNGDLFLTYKLNAITTQIKLVCVQDQKDDELVLITTDTENPVLAFYSSRACFVATASSHSLGTTLLIIFFVFVAAYLIIGCAVKHFIMGARGVEVIPNHAFWMELPSLVKDGITFVQNGFRPPAPAAPTPGQSPNPNSYDSI